MLHYLGADNIKISNLEKKLHDMSDDSVQPLLMDHLSSRLKRQSLWFSTSQPTLRPEGLSGIGSFEYLPSHIAIIGK